MFTWVLPHLCALGFWRVGTNWSTTIIENNFPNVAYNMKRIGMPNNLGIKNSPTPYKYDFERFPY